MTDPAATVRAMFDGIDRGDFGAVQATLAANARFYFNGADAPMDLAAFAAMGESFGRAFTNGRHIIEQQATAGDWTATRMSWTAMHSAAFQGVPASHRPVRIAASSFDRVVDGRITERHVLIDTGSLMAQIGAVAVAA
jgi:predicted ester cyclase